MAHILFNRSISESTFPQRWKQTVFVLIHKGGNRNAVNNYKPTVFMSVLAKSFESIITKRLFF